MGKRGKKVRRSFGVSIKMSKSNDLDWSKIEAECEREFPDALRSAIEALLQNYNDWINAGLAGWTDAELNKATKRVESAIFNFREMVIDGGFLPKHPEGPGVAQLQFASRARQAAELVPVLRAASEVEISPEESDGRLEVLQDIAARNEKLLELKPVDFRVAIAKTNRKLLASITPLIELGQMSPERSSPEVEARRQFVMGLTQVLEHHNFPTDVSESYPDNPDKRLFLRLFKALGFSETTKARGRESRAEAEAEDKTENKKQADAKKIIRDRAALN